MSKTPKDQLRRKIHYQKNRQKLLKYATSPERKEARFYNVIKYKYGITKEKYWELYNSQSGKCAICEQDFDLFKANVDHNHTNGKVRGLLCGNCNYGIGNFFDSVEYLFNVINYLNSQSM